MTDSERLDERPDASQRRSEPGASAGTADGVRIEYARLSGLVEAPRNPKRHNVPVLMASLARFGFVAPLIVDDATGQLVVGHGRLEALRAAREAGSAPPDQVHVDADGEWLVPTVRGVSFANEREAEAYLVADNRLTILGGWDESELAATLEQLSAGPLDGLGYTAAQIAQLIQAQRGEFEATDRASQGDLDERKQVTCPACGHKFSAV